MYIFKPNNIYFERGAHSYVTWLIGIWHESFLGDMTHWYVTWLIDMWYDPLICDMTHWPVTWLIAIWRDSFICDVTHSYVTWLIDLWRDSLICDMTHWYVTWLIDMWRDSLIYDMTHSYVTQPYSTCLVNIWHTYLNCERRISLSKKWFSMKKSWNSNIPTSSIRLIRSGSLWKKAEIKISQLVLYV